MSAASAARIELRNVVKAAQTPSPLRIARLIVRRGESVVLSGFDAGRAEVFVNLVTGATSPDEGDVLVGGRSTKDIADETEWLASLDRFGIVTERAVLLERMSVAANLALPFTLAIDPIADEVRARIDGLADEVGLPRASLEAHAATLSPEERVRAHLARALATDPDMLLLELPTARLQADESKAIGATLKSVAAARGLGWIALTADDRFARTTGARCLRLDPVTGSLEGQGLFRRWWPRSA